MSVVPSSISKSHATPLVLAALLTWACDNKTVPVPSVSSASSSVAVSSARAVESAARPEDSSHASSEDPARVETVSVPGDAPMFVVRGLHGSHRMVFLHGHCSHAMRYVRSFRHAAAEHGTLIAVQADRPCEDASMRRWTNTPEVLNGRVEAAFRAAGDATPLEGLAVIGYSSGAVLAEMLAHAYPERYAYVILIGGPQKPVEWRLRKSRSTVMIAGEVDRQDLMSTGARGLDAAGIPSTFLVLPGAKHGQMGPGSERIMREAFAWLWKHDRFP